MRMLLVAASVALAGCTTTAPLPPVPAANPADAVLRDNLPAICSSAQTAHLLFTLAASFGRFSERTIATERAAWEALEPLCVDPEAETTGRALDAALRAYQTIRAARAT